MADVPMTLMQPSGATFEVDMPDDVTIGELLPDLTTELSLPAVGSDGRPVSYRITSKSLGRELDSGETLASAAVPASTPLMIFPFAVAGA